MVRAPRLLVVGDDAMCRVWQIIFAGRGWQVDTATTAAEALARLDFEPDYVILDHGLPRGGGEAIRRRVRQAGLRTRVAVATDRGAAPEADGGVEAAHGAPFDVAGTWREAVQALAG